MVQQLARIIVEGVDGAGKSTLISTLVDRIGNMEEVRNEQGPDRDLESWWREELDRPASVVTPIHDRFFYSELVYGPILRGHIKVSPHLVESMLWFLRSSALLIYARPSDEKLFEKVSNNDQMEGVIDNFQRLTEEYDILMQSEKSWYGSKFIQYAWHKDGEIDRVENVVRSYLAGKLS